MKINIFGECKLIFESQNYYVIVPQMPHVDRNDGGHICIVAKDNNICSLQQLDDNGLIELSLLTRAVGDAMIETMNKHGIDVRLINYQINGNWTFFDEKKPSLHLHLYGRALSAKIQKFGNSLYFPTKKDNLDFYKNNKCVTDEDIEGMNSILVRKYVYL